ncbi:camp-dependent kinase-like protein [Heterobasidion irregulare TC 32-1]|uniref:Camp-dependent kinase-like protein n=1 Tax=Heterobasidion irregulare (strain TC 32-1) TaxID=747525 RepID=W4KDA4_HETIT|nr:camp-dependent kinase-like protein [Heterobasidion irregulare TC 32-1]ETW83280.1 camp-dependent kinase-like protein [Heterobasidion irregulare TC 32-1]
MGCCFSEPIDLDGAVNLYHFDLHRAIGKGAFGKVRVIEHKRTKKFYALKYINKQQCIRQKAVANVIQERRLLEEIDHPFIVNLRYAFQDDDNCFFALDLMYGGDLRFHLNMKGSFPERTVRFWIAELSCGLAYLHKQRIIHRDIKPDNILLDASGHAHLTDFNVAIHYSERRLHTSIAGSMAYMAPEVVHTARTGYTWHIDWWSLGVCAHELLWHKRPFHGKTADRMRESITSHPIKVPPAREGVQPVSKEGCDAILGLLERNPNTRLGCRALVPSIDDIYSHPWFARINWEKLEAKQLDAPYVPDQRKPNFDVTHEFDEFLLAEKPLTHQKRKANPNTEKMAPELRQLEEQFTIYDFNSSTRISYYPHNEPIVAAHEADSDPTVVIQSQTNTLVHQGTIIGRSRANSPVPSSRHSRSSSQQYSSSSRGSSHRHMGS